MHMQAEKFLRASVLTALGLVCAGLWAQNPAEMSDGEVRRIDPGNLKITIRHGEIKNLDMPPMSMVFQVRDAALLEKIKPGDKIRFSAEKADGVFLVTAIEAKP